MSLMTSRSCPHCRKRLSVRLSDEMLVCGTCGASYIAVRGDGKYDGCEYLREVSAPVAVPCYIEHVLPDFFDTLTEAQKEAFIKATAHQLKGDLVKTLEDKIKVSRVQYAQDPRDRLRVEIRALDTGYTFE